MKRGILLSLFLVFQIFSLGLAQTNLPLGVPTSENVESGACSQFIVDISTISPPLSASDLVTIVASPFFGDPDLYVSAQPNPGPGSFTWSSTTGAGDDITILATDTNWPTQGKFYICVFGASVQGVVSFTSSFSITAWVPTRIAPFSSASPGVVSLANGVPQVASVAAHGTSYFAFTVNSAGPTPTGNFTISVTPISTNGDPDVYVRYEGQPSQTAWDYMSTNYGADYIKIKQGSAKFETAGTYYIAVYGWLPCTFAVAAFSDSAPATLLDGVPMVQETDAHTYAQFGYYLGGNLVLTTSVTPLSANADPDLYMGLTTPVTNTNYLWRSMRVGGDSITVDIADANHKFPAFYYSGVYGFSTSVFSIVASSSASSQLIQSGVPIFGNVSRPGAGYPTTAVFYRFNVGDTAGDINIQITPQQGSGSPYFYISKPSSQVYQPSSASGKFDYACTTNGGCQLTIPANTVEKGNYYIGVYWGFSFYPTINYYLQVSTNYTTVQLLSGTPILGSVPQGYYRYFAFTIAQPQDLTIAVGALFGDPDVYISTTVNHPNASAGGFTWRSFHVGSESVNILASDPKFVVGTYYIAVYGFRDSVFSIVAYTSDSTITLNNAVPVSGVALRGEYTYYAFTVSQPNAKLTVSLAITTANGDADLYVSKPSSNNPKPNMFQFDYRSNAYGGDSIVETNQYPGVYYIGVYGYTDNVTYVISASEQDALIPDNLYITDTVTMVANNYYGIVVPQDIPSGVMSISVTVFSGNTNLYLWFGDFASPSLATANRSSTTWPGNCITVSTSDPDFVAGKWTLAVESSEGYPVSKYMIAATTSTAQLSPGVPHFSVVPAGATQTFQIGVSTQQLLGDALVGDANAPNQIISVKMYSGSVAIYASQYVTTPNASNFVAGRDYFDVSTGDHFVTIPGSSINPSQPILYISVVGAANALDGSGASYNIITYSSQVRVTLSNDQPIYSQIDNGQTSSFVANVPASSPIFTASLTSCNNNQAASFLVNTSATVYNVNGIGFAHELVLNNPLSDTVYTIDVTGGTDDSQFLLYASTTQGNIRPAPGNGGNFKASVDSPYKLSFEWEPAQTISPPLTYRIYATAASMAGPQMLQVINMQTACSLESNTMIRPITDWTAFNADSDGVIRFTIDVSSVGFSNGLYGINIATQNSLGLKEAYVPVTINPAVISGKGLSGGSIFLIVFFTLLAAYFGAGFAYNMFKGARGMEACPNIEFWRSLPGLFTDGCFFVYAMFRNCFKPGGYRLPGYAAVPDASINVDDFGVPPPPRYAIQTSPREASGLGGYGAL